MTTIHVVSKVRADGSVMVPVGVAEAGTEVEVTIAPKLSVRSAGMTQAEYADFIGRFYGAWIGDFPEIDDPPPSQIQGL